MLFRSVKRTAAKTVTGRAKRTATGTVIKIDIRMGTEKTGIIPGPTIGTRIESAISVIAETVTGKGRDLQLRRAGKDEQRERACRPAKGG